MLDPEYLERAGNLVGAVYSQIEAEMCDHLVRAMLAGDVGDWRSQRALQLLAQAQAPQLRAVLERYRDDIGEAVRREVEDALARSDAHDLSVVKRALGVDLPGITSQQIAGVVRTVTEMLGRDNIEMLSGARDAFLRESTAALTEAASGLVSPWEASRRASMRLARRGIDTIQYRDPTTGDRTVRNKVDVAVRRHVRTQLAQACANRSMQVCEEVGCGFVEVSSHVGARPSHQDWEGRCYSLHGEVTVGGVTYPDFWDATGYQGVSGDHAALGDRLQGVNCRHHFGPWFPGLPRSFAPSPRHPSGRTSEEVYRLTQAQRRMERAIRDTKRELSAAEEAYRAHPDLRTQTETNKVRDRLRRQEEAIQRLCDENKGVLTRQHVREWAGDMPRTTAPRGSGVTLDEFLHEDATADLLESKGIAMGAAGSTLRASLEDMGISVTAFAQLTASDQRAIVQSGEFHYRARAASTANNRISPQKLDRHIEGTREHATYRAIRTARGDSYQSDLTITREEARDLVKAYAGTGEARFAKNGEWRRQEQCEADRIVGVYYDMDNNPHETRWFMIVYAKKNTHIVPIKEPRR